MGWTQQAIANHISVPRGTLKHWFGQNSVSSNVTKRGRIGQNNKAGNVTKPSLLL